MFPNSSNLKNTDMETPNGYDQFEYPSLEQSVDLKYIVNEMKEELNLKSQYELVK